MYICVGSVMSRENCENLISLPQLLQLKGDGTFPGFAAVYSETDNNDGCVRKKAFNIEAERNEQI